MRALSAALRPLSNVKIAARRTVTTMSAASYPKPIVYPAAAAHKSTLIMLHGLGEYSDDRASTDPISHCAAAAAAAATVAVRPCPACQATRLCCATC